MSTETPSIRTVQNILSEVRRLHRDGVTPGLSTGWSRLDKFYTVRPGMLHVVTGIPGHGKSEFLDALAVNLIVREGWKFAFFSPENYPLEMHFKKIVQKLTGIPLENLTLEGLLKAEALLQDRWRWIGCNGQPTLDDILRDARQLAIAGEINGLVIDPWNEVEHTRPEGQSETEYISKSLSNLRTFARDHGVAVWVVAHPIKLVRLPKGEYPVPTPYDISGSANWRNKADVCLCVHRPKITGTDVEVHVQKVRFRHIGREGAVRLKYDEETGRYSS